MTQTPFAVLTQQANRAATAGDLQNAAHQFFQAAQKITAREQEYSAMLSGYRALAKRTGQWRLALAIDWYRNDGDGQHEAAQYAPDLERARTFQLWGEGGGAREWLEQAAIVYAKQNWIAHAAYCYEKNNQFEEARSLWARLSASLRKSGTNLYAAGLATFNVARMSQALGDPKREHEAVVAAVHCLEEAADLFEQVGRREKAFDCFQVLIAIGKTTKTFEHALEGYVNALRILKQDQLKHYAIETYENCIQAASEQNEFAAAATLAQEMSNYANRLRMPHVANHGLKLKATMWEQSAQAHRARQAPEQLVENALLASVVTQAELGQFATVGRLYRQLSSLDLDEARVAHYQRVASRYDNRADGTITGSALAAHLRLGAHFPDVWHVDIMEWERQGSAASACADIILDREAWSEITRRRALLACIAAQHVQSAPDQSSPVMQLERLTDALGELELYSVLSALEHLFTHPSATIRTRVVQVLGRFLYKRTFDTLRRAIEDENPEVRAMAQKSLSHLRFPHAFDPLARIYRETKHPPVREAVIMAMSRIDTHEVAEWITDALEREPPDVCKLIVTHVSQGRGRHLIQVARERMPTLPQRAQQHLAAIAAARGERI